MHYKKLISVCCRNVKFSNAIFTALIAYYQINEFFIFDIFDDLLATENYLYCYRIDYLLPRGMANDWYKGYSLKQIPIN